MRDTLHGFRSNSDDGNNKHIAPMWVHLQLVCRDSPLSMTDSLNNRGHVGTGSSARCSIVPITSIVVGKKNNKKKRQLNTGAAAREFETVEGMQASSIVLFFLRRTLIHYSCLKSDVYLLPLPLLCHPLHHAGNRQTLPPTPAAH